MNRATADGHPAGDAAITGVVLAGGRATRMGGTDKGLIELAGRPMVEHIIGRLAPQVDGLVINANRNESVYAAFGYPVVADTRSGFLGPLAGLLAGMSRARTARVVTTPCDSPFVPPDLVERLVAGMESAGADLAVAHDGLRQQPVFVLARTRLHDDLDAWLQAGGRRVDGWFARHRVADVDFSDCSDAFLNINTPDERATIEAQLEERQQ